MFHAIQSDHHQTDRLTKYIAYLSSHLICVQAYMFVGIILVIQIFRYHPIYTDVRAVSQKVGKVLDYRKFQAKFFSPQLPYLFYGVLHEEYIQDRG